MKRKFLLNLLLCFSLLIASCSKNDKYNSNDLTNSPTAKLQYDLSNYGIYKGVFVGSSGIINIDINNNGLISAMLKIDGVTFNFTTTDTIEQNQLTRLIFVSGLQTFTFTVKANGTDPIVSDLKINGHPNTAIIVVKETSTALVKCYEGVYSGSRNGILNAIIYSNEVVGLVKENPVNDIFGIVGVVYNNNQIRAWSGVAFDMNFTGSIMENNVSGIWRSNSLDGTWNCVRTF